jgi:intein/homing endonuclease
MKLSKEQVEKLRAIRWRARTDLLFLCNEILGYDKVNAEVHGPIIERLQQFKKPTREEFVLNDQFVNGKWVYRPLIPHEELEGLRRMLLLDSRGTFKCVRKGFNCIQKPDGTKVAAETVKVGDYILGTDAEYSYKQRYVKVTGVEEQPPQKCVTVRLKSGRTIDVSANHPFRKITGFVDAGTLAPGDRVATLAWLPEPKDATYEPDSELTGWFLGDGSFSNMVVTNSDEYFRERCIKAAEKAGFEATATLHRNRAGSVRVRKARDHYRSLGLFETKAGTKFIPEKYFKADNQSVRELLYGLYMSDGTAGKDGIVLVSKSERLVQDTQVLLLRFGIRSKYAKYGQLYKGERLYFYHLTVSDNANIQRFFNEIGWDKNSRYTTPKSIHSNVDTVPKEWKHRYGKYLFNRGEKPKNIPKTSLSVYDISKEKLKLYAEALEDSELSYLAENHIYWDTVDTVVDQGEHVTVGIETESNTLCLNEVITHNTTVNTIAHTIQFIINYPNIACMISVANTERAKIMLGGILEHFCTNETFRQVFPEHCPPASKVSTFGRQDGFTTMARDFSHEARKVRNEPTVHLGTIEKAVASLHFDVIKFSDVVDEENSGSREQCMKIIEAFSQKQPCVVNEKSWVFLEGTRYHNDDLYGFTIESDHNNELLKLPRQYKIFMRGCFKRKDSTYTLEDLDKPFELDAEGKMIPVFPSHMSYDYLIGLKHDLVMGKAFNAQYLNDPTSVEDAPLPVGKLDKKTLPATIEPKIFENNIKISYRDMAVDFAETTKATSDFTSMVILGWSFANKPYVEKIEVGKWGDEEKVVKLLEMYRKYRPQNIYLEDMPYTVGLFQSITAIFQKAREYPNWVWVKRRGSNVKKADRIGGALSMWWKTGELKFVEPSNPDEQSKEFQALKREARAFPKGAHDDILDCLADLMTNKTPFFERLGPRPMNSREVREDAFDKWLYGDAVKEAYQDHLYGIVPEWGADQYGF